MSTTRRCIFWERIWWLIYLLRFCLSLSLIQIKQKLAAHFRSLLESNLLGCQYYTAVLSCWSGRWLSVAAVCSLLGNFYFNRLCLYELPRYVDFFHVSVCYTFQVTSCLNISFDIQWIPCWQSLPRLSIVICFVSAFLCSRSKARF